MRDAKSLQVFLPTIKFESEGMTSHKHGLAAKYSFNRSACEEAETSVNGKMSMLICYRRRQESKLFGVTSIKSAQTEYAIPDNGYQGKGSSDCTALEEMEEARSESGEAQDPPTQDNNSQLSSPKLGSAKLEISPRRRRYPPTPLTY